MIRRREFITLLGGAAGAWPLAALGQKGERTRRIGGLMNLAADDPESMVRVGAFLQGLQELGWTDGRNVRIECRWGAGDAGSYSRYATELVAGAPDVILASGGVVLSALQKETQSVPIVFAVVTDPVGGGLSRTCHGPAVTLPDSCCSNSVWPENGWSCSNRSCRT